MHQPNMHLTLMTFVKEIMLDLLNQIVDLKFELANSIFVPLSLLMGSPIKEGNLEVFLNIQ
jgi:hypothetical protein